MTDTITTRPIRARRVSFDWGTTPLHWIPGDPDTTHVINLLHLLLPAGEKWFVEVYREALPLVTDDRLREDVRGFMGQEAVHSRAHAVFLDHLESQGIDPAPYTRKVEKMFDLAQATARRTPRPLRRAALTARLAVIAGIEHYTCVLGNWILQSRPLDEAGADPIMLDLLRWHGAEEVEHRSVAFDAFNAIAGPARYLWRVFGMALAAVVMMYLWIVGTRYLVRHDPSLGGRRINHRALRRAIRMGRLPSTELVLAIPRYLKPSHHPSQEGSLEAALEYLVKSPAAAAVTGATATPLPAPTTRYER
jgi:predicted metal-dependent hydrolase